MKCKYLPEFDFAKAVCALAIIVNHFSIDSGYIIPFYSIGENVSWGYIIVTEFFMISGFLIYRNNSNAFEWRKYYFKRWRVLFPSFYFAWGICAAILWVSGYWNELFKGPREKWTIIFTIFGFDKYVMGVFDTYAIVGEWFLGAIIIVYMVYPILRKHINHEWGILFILGVLFVGLAPLKYQLLGGFRSPVSCLISFYLGILICKEEIEYNNKSFVLSSVLFLGLILVVKNISSSDFLKNIVNHFLGFFLFSILLKVGTFAMKNKACSRLFSFLASISYEVFLIQRVVIRNILRFCDDRNIGMLAFLCILSVLVSIMFAYAIRKCAGFLFKKISSGVKRLLGTRDPFVKE